LGYVIVAGNVLFGTPPRRIARGVSLGNIHPLLEPVLFQDDPPKLVLHGGVVVLLVWKNGMVVFVNVMPSFEVCTPSLSYICDVECSNAKSFMVRFTV
jgi:hypothetical protein